MITFSLLDQQIGAGTALPGLVASLCGANVTLTDKEEYPRCLENCRQSCHANGQTVIQVVGITWGQFTPNLLNLPKADIILGSDCFYDTKGNLAPLLSPPLNQNSELLSDYSYVIFVFCNFVVQILMTFWQLSPF